MYSNRKVSFVGILSVLLLDDCMRGNQFGKVVHSKSGKNLLENVPDEYEIMCNGDESFFMHVDDSNEVINFDNHDHEDDLDDLDDDDDD